ncbi:unnamed protein product [Blepharisma stoltei]|uniref:Uncharacterized protein n=1 Tax=Blepharisma stoltei TaxID=1481888 RepID=A0AAU9JPM2_9CILI|nr:unnamed protein product [Blepharisma stoltei]
MFDQQCPDAITKKPLRFQGLTGIVIHEQLDAILTQSQEPEINISKTSQTLVLRSLTQEKPKKLKAQKRIQINSYRTQTKKACEVYDFLSSSDTATMPTMKYSDEASSSNYNFS